MKKIFLILLFILVPQISNAQILIEQGKIQLDVEPGAIISDKIKLHNTTDKYVATRNYWEDFQYVAPYDGSKKFFPAGSTPLTMNSWITFEPKELTFQPNESKEISYTIRVPENVQGGYYGVLFFEILPDSTNEDTSVKIVSRVGSLFFIEATSKLKKAIVDEVVADKNKIKFKFKNLGNTILIPLTNYYLMDNSNVVVDRGSIKKVYVPPGETAEMNFSISDSIKNEQYQLVLNFDLEGGFSYIKEAEINKNKDGVLEIIKLKD